VNFIPLSLDNSSWIQFLMTYNGNEKNKLSFG
jgi:hypothetical protein